MDRIEKNPFSSSFVCVSSELRFQQLLKTYRMFHGTLFAVCASLVLILYAFIYHAVYQRRVTRTRKLSAYRRIIRSYLMNNESDHRSTRTSKNSQHCRHQNRHHAAHEHSPSMLTLICCYCCKDTDQYMHELQRPTESALHEPMDENRREHHRRHLHEGATFNLKNPHRAKPQVILEVNGARGKRYSAISMTSMTYLTSGVWDEISSTNLIRSRINSVVATSYCGTDHSSASRPSTSTEDSLEQASKLLSMTTTCSSLHPMAPTNATHLTVPGQAALPTVVFPTSGEPTVRVNPTSETELTRSVSQSTNLLHPSIVRKSSNALSLRQQQRSSDASVHQRKVSFSTY